MIFIIRAVAIISAICAMLLVWMVRDTLISSSPIDVHESEVTIKNENGITYMFVKRKLTYLTNGELVISRSLKSKESELSLPLPTSVIRASSGDSDYRSTFIIPKIPTGTWCYNTTVVWRPMFSLVDKHNILAPACTEFL